MPTLYRVENPTTKAGLWYAENGEYSGVVTKIGYRNAELPMGYEDCMAGGWHSAVDNLEDLKQWFNHDDMILMESLGYVILEFDVDSYRIGRSETGIEHAVFQRSAVTSDYRRLTKAVLL